MSYTIYIIFSHRDRKLYVGCTQDIGKRIKRHNDGHVLATKNRRPLSLIYTETIENKAEAFNRERFLKSLWGSRFKKKVLDNFLKNQNLDR